MPTESYTFILNLYVFSFFSKNFKTDFIYLLLERWERREKERQRSIPVGEEHPPVAPHTPQTGDWTLYLGMCPGGESMPNPLSHTSQSYVYFQNMYKLIFPIIIIIFY